MTLTRRLAGEALGTAFLLMGVVGSGIMAERLAGGNVALALWGNTAATGALLVVLILVFGPVSGAHFNPAVTLVFALRREISAPAAVAYVIVQCASAIGGVVLAHLMFDAPVISNYVTARTGPGQWLAETIATFGLLAAILGCLRTRAEAIPYAVGLYITAAYWFTASTSFANPAVTIGRAFTGSFSGIRSVDVAPFIAAQLIGAVTAFIIFGWLDAARAKKDEVRAVASDKKVA